MKEAKLYLSKDIKDLLSTCYDDIPVFKTILISDDDSLWGKPIKIGDKFYSVGSSYKEYYSVDEFDYFKCDEEIDELEEWAEDNIKCPVCGCVDIDSWEHSRDEDEEYQCSGCGSILSWERKQEVTYNTTVKKINEFRSI